MPSDGENDECYTSCTFLNFFLVDIVETSIEVMEGVNVSMEVMEAFMELGYTPMEASSISVNALMTELRKPPLPQGESVLNFLPLLPWKLGGNYMKELHFHGSRKKFP